MIPEMRAVPGNRGVRILRRLDEAGAGTTIVVVSYWSDLDSIRAFAGLEPARAVVPDAAQALLQTYDRSVEHFAVEHSDPEPIAATH